MKKLSYKISTFLVGILFMVSCADNDIPIYDTVNGQTLAQFSLTSAVLGTPEEGASVDVDVTVTTKTDSERTITVAADPSSTATPDQYEISNLVIPAGSYTGTITITSNFNAIPESGTSVLVLNLTDVSGSNDIVFANSTLNVEFFRKCPIVLADFVGTWSGTGSWSEIFGYTSEIVTTLDSDGNLLMNGIAFQWFQGWWGEVIITNEPVKVDVNLETGEFVIEDQFYITSTYNGAPQPTYNLSATGTFLNPCEKTMEIFPTFNQEGFVFSGPEFGGPPFLETVALD
jgi:hypothetical protein